MDLDKVLLRLHTKEFDHLGAHGRDKIGRKLKEFHFITTCTEIECDSLIVNAVTDEERSLGQRAKLKFMGTGRKKDTDANPWLDKLKLAFVRLRACFPAIALLSTKNDDHWHAVDIENTPAERAHGVLVWRSTLTITKCKARMEHYEHSNLEEYPLSVLCDFREVFEAYNTAECSVKNAPIAEERAAKRGRGCPPGRGASLTVLQKGTLEVVSLSLRSLLC